MELHDPPRRCANGRGSFGAALALAAVVALVIAVSAARPQHSTVAAEPSAAPYPPLAILHTELGAPAVALSRLDPLTLEPAGVRLNAAVFGSEYAFSPDRQQLAIPTSATADVARGALSIVDLKTMRRTRSLAASRLLAWLAPRRLVLWSSGHGWVHLRFVNPDTGRTISRRRVPYFTDASWVAGTNGVLVGASANGTVVAVTASGNVKTAKLRPLAPSLTYVSIAIDADGQRAFIAAHGGPLAEVDLRTMRIRYHALRPANRVRPGFPVLVWLGNKRLAVGGYTTIDVELDRYAPDGVRLLDTRTWRETMLDRSVAEALRVGDRLIVSPGYASGGSYAGYTLDGRLVFRRAIDPDYLESLSVAGDYLYARTAKDLETGEGDKVTVIDLRSGETVAERTGSGLWWWALLQPHTSRCGFPCGGAP